MKKDEIEIKGLKRCEHCGTTKNVKEYNDFGVYYILCKDCVIAKKKQEGL